MKNLAFTVTVNEDDVTINLYNNEYKSKLLNTYTVENSPEGFMSFAHDVKAKYNPDNMTLLASELIH
jgi:hypothetical protein